MPIEAVVLASGGQDSTTCLGWAIARWGKGSVVALGFSYGQKHSIENQQAQIICDELGVPLKMVSLDFLPDMVESALTSGGDVNAWHAANPELPASFVPNRNALFLTLAHAYAQKLGAGNIVGGMCETDYSGYPDCRNGFIQSIANVLNLGSGAEIKVYVPLMWMNKEQTFRLAEQTGVLDIVLEHSHTCYNGDRSERHPWGYGCGKCPACYLRKNGFEEYQAQGR